MLASLSDRRRCPWQRAGGDGVGAHPTTTVAPDDFPACSDWTGPGPSGPGSSSQIGGTIEGEDKRAGPVNTAAILAALQGSLRIDLAIGAA
jgi:hypothetical protein